MKINKKNYLMIICLTIISILFMLMLSNYSYASPIDDPNFFAPNGINPDDTGEITQRANQIIGAITTVGIMVAVTTTIVLGIKYVLGSVEEKAEYKKSMLPYIVGMIFLLSASVIVKIIAGFAQGANLT